MLLECPHADRCPGCPLIGLAYPEQLSKKERAVSRALGAYPALSQAAIEPVAGAANAAGYRVRAKFVASRGKLGLYSRGSHEVVDIPACPVLTPRLRDAADAVRRVLASEPGVSSVDLREADDGVLVTLAGTLSGTAFEHLVERVARDVPGVLTIATAERKPNAARVLPSAPRVRHGPTAARHHLSQDGPYHYASPGAFTQLHSEQAARAYALVAERLAASLGTLSGASVLELYAGSGALALRLARAGAVVTAVESHAPAAEQAGRAAREQNLSLTSLAADAGDALDELAAASRRFDAVVVNPPRRGLTPAVRRLVGELGPRALVYVSCDPGTFARDADDLARLGLSLEHVTPFDMIPLSEAVETIATFRAAPPPAPRVLFEDEALVAVSKSPHEPTTPQGEHRGSLLVRVRTLPGCANAVPVHRLDVGTSGVCLFARSPEKVEVLARALAAGTKEYVALVRGIARKRGQIARSLKESGKERLARTRYVRRRVVGGHSLVVVSPEAGRTHQVRRHLAGVGHPVLGDERYGDHPSNTHFEHAHALDRSFLHLESIALELAGTRRTLGDELAPDLAAVLESLGASRDRT
jgi:tRNA/tmRNA/rRNA uracil-C5-methylase (TrmA/RlmC/RlmD family)/16S rRNA U516 pseudouridylate synthase RsuA-like enzyme